MIGRCLRFLIPLVLVTNLAAAQDSGAQKQANEHYRRAIDLYSEADYRGALVEFKRAYEIAPNNTVLYNLGQTYYQLAEYARALSTFEKYLASDASAHRSEVEQTVSVLKSRVGKLDISCASGWEVAVDDETVGKCPLSGPLPAGVGRRKITASASGKTPVTHYADVAAGETAAVVFTPATETTESGQKSGTEASPQVDRPKAETDSSRGTWLTIGWIATGVFAAGSAVAGANALNNQKRLDDARQSYPGDPNEIDSRSRKTRDFALGADILGAAAIVTGGVTLYFALSGGKSDTEVGFGPTSVRITGHF